MNEWINTQNNGCISFSFNSFRILCIEPCKKQSTLPLYNPYPGFLLSIAYQYNFTFEIRILLFLFLCVSHLPHPVSNQRSLENKGSTIIPAFSAKVWVSSFHGCNLPCLQESRLLYHTFTSCTPNPTTISYKSLSWCPFFRQDAFHLLYGPQSPLLCAVSRS